MRVSSKTTMKNKRKQEKETILTLSEPKSFYLEIGNQDDQLFSYARTNHKMKWQNQLVKASNENLASLAF